MAAGRRLPPRRPVRSAAFVAALAAALSCAVAGTVATAQAADQSATLAPAPTADSESRPPIPDTGPPGQAIDPGSGPIEADGSARTGEAALSTTVEEALAQAERLILAGEPVAAFAALMATMDALPESTDDAALRFAVAQALIAGGRLEQAGRVLARLSEEWPDNLRIRLDLAAVLFELGRDEEAEALFRDALRAPDLSPDVRRNVDGFLERIDARRHLRVDPYQAAEAALIEAELQIAAGDPDAALATVDWAMDALPGNADDSPLRFAMAQALIADGRLGRAERVLARLSEGHPDNLRIRLDHAAVLFALGRDRESRELFREIRARAGA